MTRHPALSDPETRATFLKQIVTDPTDLTVRLIYADWLEERDNDIDAGKAAWIRYQIRTKCETPPERTDEKLTPEDIGYAIFSNEIMRVAYEGPERGQPLLKHNFRDGFVYSIALRTDKFLEYAGALFAAAPITHVKLAGRVPDEYRFTGGSRTTYDWWSEFWAQNRGVDPNGRDIVPDVLFDLFGTTAELRDNRYIEFPTRAAALAALSAVCVAYGRHKAGLPPLRKEGT